MSFIIGKKVGMTRTFSDDGAVTPVTVIFAEGGQEFKAGDLVKIAGITKGRGFQGAVKRHGFHGMPASHGHHHVLRHVGSIGQRFPQHTLKGMRMAGHMGAVRQTTRGLTVVSMDKEQNMLAVKGAVPGRKGTVLEISKI